MTPCIFLSAAHALTQRDMILIQVLLEGVARDRIQ